MKKLSSLLVALATTITVMATEGALPGKFTINAQGDQVVFSQGNLQYKASIDMWRFAKNQYDTIGSRNANISPAYTGWIDLFGWGSGNDPVKTTTNEYAYIRFMSGAQTLLATEATSLTSGERLLSWSGPMCLTRGLTVPTCAAKQR